MPYLTYLKRFLLILFLFNIIEISFSEETPTDKSPTQSKLGKTTYESFTKTDFDTTYRVDNLIWSPYFIGGVGVEVNRKVPDRYYPGGTTKIPFKENLPLKQAIVGVNTIETAGDDFWELQGTLQLKNGFGAGIGHFDFASENDDSTYGKIIYENQIGNWKYYLDLLVLSDELKTNPGGYAILYNEQFMIGGGSDSEEYSAAIGYVAPKSESFLRPVAEFLVIDKDPGDFSGPRSYTFSAALLFEGGFLRHEARMGRILGRTGNWFDNYVSSLPLHVNRQQEVQTLGKIVSTRVTFKDFPDGTQTKLAELVVFPFEISKTTNPILDGVFIGPIFFDPDISPKRYGAKWGLRTGFGFFKFDMALSYDSEEIFESNLSLKFIF